MRSKNRQLVINMFASVLNFGVGLGIRFIGKEKGRFMEKSLSKSGGSPRRAEIKKAPAS